MKSQTCWFHQSLHPYDLVPGLQAFMRALYAKGAKLVMRGKVVHITSDVLTPKELKEVERLRRDILVLAVLGWLYDRFVKDMQVLEYLYNGHEVVSGEKV